MVPNQIEGCAMAHLKGLLQRKKMMVGGKSVSPVFGTLTVGLVSFRKLAREKVTW